MCIIKLLVKKVIGLIILLFLIVSSFFSCSKDSEIEKNDGKSVTKEEVTPITTPKKSNIYKISELPNLPDFALPITKANEVRKFILIQDDGTQLDFNLKGVKEKLFGKMRTFVGVVSTKENEEKNAIMILGENGFELFFENSNDFFRIKNTKSLDFGYKELDLNFDNVTKSKFLAYAKEKNIDGEILLNKFLNNNKDRFFSGKFNSTQNYVITNQNKNERNSTSEEEAQDQQYYYSLNSSHHYSNNSNQTKKLNIIGKEEAYNIEIVYMESNYDFLNGYVNLIYSFIKLAESKQGIDISARFSVVPNVEQFLLPLVKLENREQQATENAKIYYEYMSLLEKVPNSDIQLSKLGFYTSRNIRNVGGEKIIRCSLYKESWGNIWGMTLVGIYPYSDNISPYSSQQSVLISCDKSHRVFPHEVGHSLGAVHTPNNKEDIMFPKPANSINKKAEHFDSSNIDVIKDALFKTK